MNSEPAPHPRTVAEKLTIWRYKFVPDHLIGEVLSKGWVDSLVPFVSLGVVVVFFGSAIPNFFTAGHLADTGRQVGEFCFVAFAMTVVMLGGGIDLSVGSNFALANFVALLLINLLHWPLWLAIPAVACVGGLVGFFNGVLIGFLRLRAFLVTLVTLIITRAIVDSLLLHYAVAVSSSTNSSAVWNWMGDGSVLFLPSSFACLIVVGVILHIGLTRTRPGWHVTAIGGSRRAAHNAGISVRATVAATYAASGLLVGMGALFYAARLGSAGSETGVGLEIMALTAAVLGGTSLGGGRGSVVKTAMGSVIVLLVTNGLIELSVPAGSGPLVLGLVLLFAVAVDIRWLKNRGKVLAKVYVSPGYFELAPSPSIGPESKFALNQRLRGVELIGKGEIESPEDVILDRDDNLYCGTRHGDIVRFFGPDHRDWEIYGHIGGQPLGLAFDATGNLLVCVGGMGLYLITPGREVRKVTDETNRTPWSVIDDSRLRLADDLDIAPDGRIFFSEATVRYEMHEWPIDSLECRGNGRIICYNPVDGSTRTVIRNRIFPNGICIASDRQSFFFAETFACRINRYWFDGPKAGTIECVIPVLPGYPDNINRASDGNYWLALVGMRTPAMDLALQMPGFRKRMSRRVAADEWMCPNINTGCVVKFDENGNILESLWDMGGENHPMITSMREHRGYLYLGGISNNRIGKYRVPGADPNWTSQDYYWGPQS